MFKVLLKFWLGTAILYLIGHFVLTSHLRTAAGDAFAASNYGFVEVKRVSLPLDALVRMRVEGHATVIIDRRSTDGDVEFHACSLSDRARVSRNPGRLFMPNLAALKYHSVRWIPADG